MTPLSRVTLLDERPMCRRNRIVNSNTVPVGRDSASTPLFAFTVAITVIERAGIGFARSCAGREQRHGGHQTYRSCDELHCNRIVAPRKSNVRMPKCTHLYLNP